MSDSDEDIDTRRQMNQLKQYEYFQPNGQIQNWINYVVLHQF